MKEKREGIQVLRLIGFCTVLLQHCSIAHTATWGVTMFFVISGFVLTYSNMDKDIKIGPIANLRFSIDHIKRIYALHVVMTLFALCLEIYSAFVSQELDLALETKRFLAHILLIHAWNISGLLRDHLNGPTWFLSALAFLYFVYPFFLQYLRKNKKHFLITLSIFIWILQFIITYLIKDTEQVLYYTYFFPPYRLFEILQGSVLAIVFINRNEKEKNRVIKTYCEAVVIICNVFVIIMANGWYNINTWFENSLFNQPFVILMIWIFAKKEGHITDLLTNHISIKLGTMAGGLFVVHEVVYYYIQAIGMKLTGQLMINEYISLVLVASISFLFVTLWERFLKNMKENRFE